MHVHRRVLALSPKVHLLTAAIELGGVKPKIHCCGDIGRVAFERLARGAAGAVVAIRALSLEYKTVGTGREWKGQPGVMRSHRMKANEAVVHWGREGTRGKGDIVEWPERAGGAATAAMR